MQDYRHQPVGDPVMISGKVVKIVERGLWRRVVSKTEDGGSVVLCGTDLLHLRIGMDFQALAWEQYHETFGKQYTTKKPFRYFIEAKEFMTHRLAEWDIFRAIGETESRRTYAAYLARHDRNLNFLTVEAILAKPWKRADFKDDATRYDNAMAVLRDVPEKKPVGVLQSVIDAINGLGGEK